MIFHSAMNESIRLQVTDEADPETASSLAAFCRRNGFVSLFSEILAPLIARNHITMVLAVTERPWPPKGIGSRTVEALAMAMVGADGRAALTPVLTGGRHATNIGLMSVMTKQLLEVLSDRGVPSVGYLVRQDEPAIERALEQAGFGRSDLFVSTEHAEYLEHAAAPRDVLAALGLEKRSIGETLELAFKPVEIDRLSAYHFALATAVRPHLVDAIDEAAVLAGLIDLVATLPPGGVPPGTPGPQFPSGQPGER